MPSRVISKFYLVMIPSVFLVLPLMGIGVAADKILGPVDVFSIGARDNFTYTDATGMTALLQVPIDANTPDPAWDAAYGGQYGRQQPPPELLQPTLDRNLTSFRPKYPYLNLNGTRIAYGSEIMAEMCKRWSIGFRHYYPLAYFDCTPPFTGDLVGEALAKNNVSVGFVGRELKPIEVINFHDKFNYTPASVPVSGGTWRHFAWLDAPIVMTHKDNPIQGMTFKTFDSIFGTTRYHGGKNISTWGDVPNFPPNHPLASQKIEIYGNAVWNGFEEFMRQKILNTYPNGNPVLGDFNIYPKNGAKRGQWKSAYSNASDFFVGGVPAERMNQTADPSVHWLRLVFDLAHAVSTSPNAVGYTGLAYVDSPVKILPLSVGDHGPFIGASYENIADASYPLSRVTYANVNKRPGVPLEPILEEFLNYIVSKEGQQEVLNQGIYTPLRQFQVEAGKKRYL